LYGYVGIHESWEDSSSEEEQWAIINIERKRSSYIEKDCIEKSQNYCSTDELQQNGIFITKTLFPQKLSDVSFTNPTSTVGLKLLNL
jgi:hypothetical protein